jgi:hypothetical protein
MSDLIDSFTLRRLVKFIEKYREGSGQLPMLSDFEKGGFEKSLIQRAERDGHIEQFYVTLTDGSIRKGYKIKG